MRSPLTEIDKVGSHILLKGEEVIVDTKEGNSETDISNHAQKIRELLNGSLPLEMPVEGTFSSDSPAEGEFPLTDIQYAYLIGRSPGLELGGLSSSLYMELDLDNPDFEALNNALNETIAYHPMLRAVVAADGQQKILSQLAEPYKISVSDGSAWSESERNGQLEKIRQEMETGLLPLDKAPSFAIKATLLGNNSARLHVYFDLMFVDMPSVRLVMGDWWRRYSKSSLEARPCGPAFNAYLDAEKALQQQSQGQRDQAYWEARLDDLPPSPELPLKNSPEQLSPPKFKRVSRSVSLQQLAKLKEVAQERGFTLETLFFGAYVETLRQWSKRQSFTVTLTQLGRRQHFDGIENTVGNFLQPGLFPVNADKDSTFTQRLAQLQTDLITNRWHSSYNGIQALRELTRRRQENRAASAPVVFSNTLTADLEEIVSEFGWTEARQVYNSNHTPQVWLENQLLRMGDELQINWNYVDGLFPEGMVDMMLEAYINLLNACENASDIWEKSGSVVALPSADLEERQAANDTQNTDAPRLLHEMVFESAKKSPESVAIVQGEREMTYGELAATATEVGRRIREQVSIKPGDMVVVSLPQGPELIVGILGVLAAGGVYVAIDPSLPEQRRVSLMQRCSTKMVVTDRNTFPNADEFTFCPRIDIDDCQTDSTGFDMPEPVQGLDDLAYVIFTSGSTGEPKGVMISHRNASNTVIDINRRFQVTADDVVFSVAPAGFDLSVYDYFGLLGAGGRVVFQEQDATNDPQLWGEALARYGVTIWNSVPAPVKALADRCGEQLAQTRLRLVLMSGDWIPVDLPGQLRETLPQVDVISLGGATEGSIWSICYPIHEVDQKWSSIPYGKPLANQRFHVFNDWMSPSPRWVTGELYIAGEGVAQGYLADPEKTAQRFFDHPETGERIYKTGDLGRYIADGLIEILGREDSQVKINGYRVELGEVEACLLANENASHIVIDAPVHPKTGQRHLVAYVVPAGNFAQVDQDALQEQLKEAVRKELPSYMVPTYYTILEEMPLTSNGKIDRKALPTPWPEMKDDSAGAVEPSTEIEARLLKLWREQLKHDDFDVTDGFFDIGGDSLHAVGLLSALREEFDVTPASEQDMIEGLFMNSNIQSFSQIIESLTQPEVASNS